MLTVPNALASLRLILIGVFVYLLLGAHAYGWAVAVLMVSGASDWADGKIARLLNQYSRLGELLDPAVDRLYMLVVPVVDGARRDRAVVDHRHPDRARRAAGRDAAGAAQPRALGAARHLHRQGRDVRVDVGVPADPAGTVGRAVEPGDRRVRLGVPDLGYRHVPVVVRALRDPAGAWWSGSCRRWPDGDPRSTGRWAATHPDAGLSARQAAQVQKLPVPSLLRSLLSEHLDPGYAAAAAGPDAGRRRPAGSGCWQAAGRAADRDGVRRGGRPGPLAGARCQRPPSRCWPTA